MRLILFSFLALPLGVSAAIGVSNNPPVAVNDSATVSSGISTAISVLANDSDPDFDPISISSFTQPLHGSVFQSATQLVYQSFAAYCGADSFNYTITDGRGGFSNATVFLTVTNCGATNQNPVANLDFASVGSGSNVFISVLANDFDPNGDPISISSFTQPLHGSVFQSGTQLVYQSSSPYCGPDQFTYTISDSHGGFATTNVTLTVSCVASNQNPVANIDFASVISGGSVTISVLNNDFDPNGDPLSIFSYSQPAFGFVNLSGTQLVYQSSFPNCGPDSFSYTISDGHGGFATTNVSVSVTCSPSNQPPVAVNDFATVGSGVSTFINVLTNDYDPDFNPISIFSYSQPANGSVFFSGGLYYQSINGYTGSDSFNYTITDNNGGFSTAFVGLTVTNSGPTNPPVLADLSLQKTNSPSGPVLVGNQIIYTLYVANAGPGISSNVVVQDTIPAGTAFVSASGGGCTYNAGLQRVDCSLGDMASGGSASVSVTVQVNAVGQIVNTGSVSGTTGDPNLTNNTSSVTNTAVSPTSADLQLTKFSSSTNAVQVGQQIIYTLSVFNGGPGTAANVVVSDTIPSGATFVTASGGACTYFPGPRRVDCNVGSIAASGNTPVFVTVQVNALGSLVNCGTVSSTTADSNPANNTSCTTNTGVAAQADLSVTKNTSASTPRNIGDQIIYTLGGFNGGPSLASNVVIRDTLPPGVSLVSVTGSGNTYSYDTNLNRVDVNLGNLAVASPTTTYLTVQVNAQVGTLLNCANIFSDMSDTNTANNTSCVTNVTTLPSADLRVTKTASTNSVPVGSNVVFNLTLRNTGPSSVTNQIIVSEVIPSGYDYIGDNSAGSGNIYSYGLGQWIMPTGIVVGATQTLAITLRANTNGVFTNTAIVNVPNGVTDPNTNNNVASAVVTNTLPLADLQITKTASTSPVLVGDTVVFNLTLRNNGPATVTNQVVVSEVIPSGFDYVGDNSAGTGNYYSFGLGQWVMPTGIVANATQTVAITLRATAIGTYTNRAIIVVPPDITDPNTNNNSSSAVVTNIQPVADLQITKTASTNRAFVGQAVVFNLTLRNVGPDAVTNSFYVDDILPSGYYYVSNAASGGTAYSLGQGRWLFFTGIAANTTQTLAITTLAITNGVFTNTAIISPPPGLNDPNTNNNSASVVVTNVFLPADLSVVKYLTASNVNVHIGEEVSFTLVVSNAGPTTVSNVLVPDVPDAGLEIVFVAAGTNAVFNALSNTFTVLSLAPTGSVTLEVRAAVTGTGLLTNRVSVLTPPLIADTNTTNNASAAYVSSTPASDLQLTKTANVTVTNRLRPITFTITLRNAGPNTSSNMVVQDALPPGTTLLSSSVPPDTAFNPATGQWTVPSLAQFETRTLLLTMEHVNGATVTNTAFIASSPHFDPTPLDRTNSVVVTWLPNNYVDLSVVINLETNIVMLGQVTRVEYAVRNLGINTASNIVLSVPIPPGVEVVGVVAAAGWSNNLITGTWTRTNNMFSGTTSFPGYDVRATNGGLKTFTAALTSEPFDPNLLNNSFTTNFVSGALVHILGQVRCAAGGPGQPGVTVTLTTGGGPTRVATTDAGGGYSFSNLPPAAYTVTPTQTGFTFAPVNQTLTPLGGVTNLPVFLAIARDVTGLVLTEPGAVPVPGIAVRLSGAANATLRTDNNGAFRFANLNPGNYTVTPLTNGQPAARFSPTNAAFVLGLATCTNTATFLMTNAVVVLRALEVVQVSQDWLNSVPLVADKATLVRAHLQLPGTNTTPVDVRGARLWATNLGSGASVSWAPANGHVLVQTNDASSPPFRSNIATTLNFPLPDFWRSDRMEYRLEWTNGVIIPREPAEIGGVGSNSAVRVSFTNMPSLGIRMIKVAWTNAVTNFFGPFRIPIVSIVTNEPTDAQIIEERRRVLTLYPAVRFEVLNGYYFWKKADGAPSDEDKLVEAIETERKNSTDAVPGPVTNRIWYGVVVLPLTLTNRGQAQAIPSRAAQGVVSRGANDYQRYLAAHELGHALGRHHAVTTGYVLSPNGFRQGRCGEEAALTAPNYPMVMFPIFGQPPSLTPTLGPMSAPDEFIWGYDHLQSQVISPFFTFDLMSYCHGRPTTTPWPWSSKYTYTNLMNGIINRYGAKGAPPQSLHGHAKLVSSSMLVRGFIRIADDFSTFQPCYPIAEGAVPTPEPGDYLLRIVDGGGLPLFEVPFTPTQAPVELGVMPENAFFSLEVPVLPAAAGAILFHNGVPIGTIGASANAPVVQLLTPNGGEAFGAGGIHAGWSGSDPDGDPLHYLLQFSPDGGGEWITVSLDWDGNTQDLPPDVLAATVHGRLRVIASDGFRFSSDDSDGEFVILNHGPAVAIDLPGAGEQFIGEQTIQFAANANDLEQGPLSGTNLVWTSDRDGVLGTGDLLLREVSTLSEGAHLITVTATDDGGLTNSAAVTINVAYADLPRLDIALSLPNVLLSWPMAAATNYHLQRAVSLPGAWSNVTNAPLAVDDKWQVTLPAGTPEKYFRLTKP